MENLTLGRETRGVVTRMEHIHLQVKDIERSIRFYRDLFGFEVRWDGTGPYGRTVHIGADLFYVAMTEDEGLEPSGSSPKAQIVHVGFATGDLAAFRKRVEALGASSPYDATRKEGCAVYVTDPDGHEIEVVEYVEGYAYA